MGQINAASLWAPKVVCIQHRKYDFTRHRESNSVDVLQVVGVAAWFVMEDRRYLFPKIQKKLKMSEMFENVCKNVKMFKMFKCLKSQKENICRVS